jgi:hypothetical protein
LLLKEALANGAVAKIDSSQTHEVTFGVRKMKLAISSHVFSRTLRLGIRGEVLTNKCGCRAQVITRMDRVSRESGIYLFKPAMRLVPCVRAAWFTDSNAISISSQGLSMK